LIALYVSIFVSVTVIHVFVVKPIFDEIKRRRRRVTPDSYALGEGQAVRKRYNGVFRQVMRRPFLNLLIAIGEDGLFLVPVLWIGIHPFTLVVAAIAFGAMHYPKYSLLQCQAKSTAYFLAMLFILPHGLLNMVAGHVLLDSIALGLVWYRSRRQTKTELALENSR